MDSTRSQSFTTSTWTWIPSLAWIFQLGTDSGVFIPVTHIHVKVEHLLSVRYPETGVGQQKTQLCYKMYKTMLYISFNTQNLNCYFHYQYNHCHFIYDILMMIALDKKETISSLFILNFIVKRKNINMIIYNIYAAFSDFSFILFFSFDLSKYTLMNTNHHKKIKY